MIKIQALLANPHTRYAGMIYVICKVGIQIMQIWFDSYDAKLRATAEIIEGVAVMYGLSAAGAGNATLGEVGADMQAEKASRQP